MRPILYYALTAAIAFAVYANSLTNEFVFDDESVVVGDPSLTSLSNIPKYFTAQEGFHKVIGRYYRPLVSTTYNLDYTLYGLEPFGFHLTNVLIHVINCLLFLKLLFLLFKTYQTKTAQLIIFLSAVIFAVLPVHTEAVTWVSGRTDSLAFTFFIASFICYLRYAETRKNSFFFLTLLMYILSLFTKEMAITFPVLIILYDLLCHSERSEESRGIRTRRRFFSGFSNKASRLKKNLVMYISLVAVSVLYMVMRWLILRDVPQRPTYFYFYGKDFLILIATMLQTVPLYFRLLFVPTGLLYHYNGYLPYQNSFLNIQVIWPIVFIVIMLVIAFRKSVV